MKKGLGFSMEFLIATIVAIAVATVIFAGVAGAMEGQADQATCTGWLRPILSTLADLVDIDLC
jgi:hypothetical protein